MLNSEPMRWLEVLRRVCPYCAGGIIYLGHSLDDGPLAAYLDCESCDVRWVVENGRVGPSLTGR